MPWSPEDVAQDGFWVETPPGPGVELAMGSFLWVPPVPSKDVSFPHVASEHSLPPWDLQLRSPQIRFYFWEIAEWEFVWKHFQGVSSSLRSDSDWMLGEWRGVFYTDTQGWWVTEQNMHLWRTEAGGYKPFCSKWTDGPGRGHPSMPSLYWAYSGKFNFLYLPISFIQQNTEFHGTFVFQAGACLEPGHD